MMTRADTPAGVRVEVWQPHMLAGWYWSTDRTEGRVYGEFPTLKAAVADAQRVHGADVRIVRHTEENAP